MPSYMRKLVDKDFKDFDLSGIENRQAAWMCRLMPGVAVFALREHGIPTILVEVRSDCRRDWSLGPHEDLHRDLAGQANVLCEILLRMSHHNRGLDWIGVYLKGEGFALIA